MRTNDLKRVLWLLLLSVGLAAVGRAQSYIRLTDATGLPPDARELDSLKEASRILEELVTLYAPGGGSFKVFDVGLYSHGQYFSGGYEELFETARRQAASQSEQYLLLVERYGLQGDFRPGVRSVFGRAPVRGTDLQQADGRRLRAPGKDEEYGR